MSKHSTHLFWEAEIKRKGLRCEVPGCNKPRWKLGRFCRNHQYVSNQYGHPLGKWIRLYQYQIETDEIRSLFRTNPHHPGLKEALKVIDQQFLSGLTKLSREREWLQVIDHQVPALEILIRITALYLYSWRNPSKLPDDNRLTYALARAVFKSAKKAKQLERKTVLEATGKLLRERLSAFFWNICKSFDQLEENREKIIESYQQPWSFPQPAQQP